MFDLGKQFVADSVSKVVAAQSVKCSLEQRQRDVYESHRHRVFSLAFYMTGSEVEAESILTETFVRAFQSDPEPDGALVDRSLLGRLREQYPLDERHAGPMPAISNVAVTRNVLRTELEESIQELPATERMIFLLRDVECYSTAAIAGLLHMPESSVQRVLMMARLRLRQQLAAGVMGTSPIPHLEAA